MLNVIKNLPRLKGLCYNPRAMAVSFQSKIRNWQRVVQDAAVRSYPQHKLEARAEYFTSLFSNHLTPASRVLDIGGGWGFYAAPLEKRGHDLTVLDVIKPGFQRAPVIIYDGGKMPFEDKSFDASILVTMLHHTPDPASILKEAVRVTRGKIVVIEDVYNHALGKFWTILRDQFYNVEYFGHPCQFKKSSEWIELFNSLGLKLVEEKQVYTSLSGLSILNAVFVLDV